MKATEMLPADGGDGEEVLARFAGAGIDVDALAKVLAQRIIPELESQTEPTLGHDSSTNHLIRRYRQLRNAR